MSEQLAQFTPQVFRFAMRLTRDRHRAEDLTQETMYRACRNFSQLQSPDRLLVWILKITVNLFRDDIRRQKRQSVQTLLQEPESSAVSAEDNLLTTERLQAALQAMDSLPERQRTVLHLFAVEQMSLAEIAAILDTNVNAAKANLFHARQAMHRRLPQEADAKQQADH